MKDFFDNIDPDEVQLSEPLELDDTEYDIKYMVRDDVLCIINGDLIRNDDYGDKIAKCAARLPNRRALYVQLDGSPLIDFGMLREKGETNKRGKEKKNKININGAIIASSPSSIDIDKTFKLFQQYTLSTPFAKIVVNKSSKIVLSDKDTSLIDQILAEGDWKYAAFVFCTIGSDPRIAETSAIFSNRDIVTWLTFLRSVIPVYLVCEADMPDSPVPVEFSVSETKDEIIPEDYEIMEWLGFYCYEGKSRQIYLCPERIKDTAQRLKIPFEHLFAIVYIHELGHAALDSTIDLDKEKNVDGTLALKVTGERKGYSSRFEYVMEESLANMIMLQYMEWYSEIKETDAFWESAESFVKKQRPSYSYGLTLLKDNVDWQLWRNNRCRVDASKKSEWLEVFESIMNPLKRVNAYNNLFNNI